MCGICGIAYKNPADILSVERLTQMRDTLSHRGPDGSGHWVGPGVGLGHRRLSIIDVEGGRQPLSNEDGAVWLAFNGEIYNYRELGRLLERRGHVFRTRTDSEVIVHAYEEYGTDCVHHLNGMFAFAIFDSRKGRLFLARDPLGIKPLFYAVTDEGLFFASEVKAVLRGAGIEYSMKRESLQEYLVFRYVAGENTFFEGVKRLPPGSFATWDRETLGVTQYWLPPEPSMARYPRNLATESLRVHLEAAARGQLMSDVPVGAFCSGGIDSGLVTVFASQAASSQLKTYSVGFQDPSWDETPLAKANAQAAATDHEVVVMTPEQFSSLYKTLIWYNDEPLSHPNSVPLYVLSKSAKRHVKVVLTGEGSDEMFLGYPRYHIARLAYFLRKSLGARKLGARALRVVPGHRAARIADYLPFDYPDSLLLNSAYVHPGLVERLTGGSLTAALAERRRILERSWVEADPLSSVSRFDMHTYLGCALDRMDRMSMAAGLEARVPFLDMPLVEWACDIPPHLKLAGTKTKRVVKDLASGVLPREVVRAPKSGFGLPLGEWFRSEGLSAALQPISEKDHPAADYFEPRVLKEVTSQHLRGEQDHGELLWLLANVFAWHKVHGEGRPKAL